MRIHCTAAAAAALLAASAVAFAQQPAAAPAPGDAVFGVFLGNNEIGREQVTLARSGTGWIITSSGNIGAPVNMALTRFQMKYSADWEPLEMTLEQRVGTASLAVSTSFAMTTAINEITQDGKTLSKNDQISSRTIVLPNNVFGGYEALAARLWDTKADAELPVYVAPRAEVKVRVRSVSDQTITGPAKTITARRFELTFQNPDRAANAVLVVDNNLRVVRFDLPDIGLSVVRDDAASVAMRAQTARNPTDADVFIPANGFQLAGTLTTPAIVAGRLHQPAIVLVGGISPADRDEPIDGVPVFAALAKALSDRGYVVLRYDRRGAGQSGGRTESATLADYADDAIAAVKWLKKRPDVDDKKLIVAGYQDGGAVALTAAAHARDIDGVITMDASGSLGADLLLVQQQRVLDQLNLSPADRVSRIELQKKIEAAVVSGKGWEGIPDAIRRQADTPWFKSMLTYDPSQVVARVRQPILILQADNDVNVPPSEADRLAEIARARKKAPEPDLVHIAGADRTFADAKTRTIDDKAVAAIADWMKKL